MRPATQKVNRSQTGLSLTLLALIVIIAVGVLYTQSQFNPAVVQWQQLAAGDDESPTSEQPTSDRTIVPLPDQLTGLTPPETFDPQSLSDKINGKAELYLASGFERLDSQRFTRQGQTQPWMELYIYAMGQFENAYSVFSVQRRDKATPYNLVEYGYQTENALFLVHGSYYLEIIASEPGEEMIASMQSLAEAFVENTETAQATLTENQLFPAEGLVADSIARIPANAFGHERLDKVFTAIYNVDESEIMAFISKRQSATEAAELAGAYGQFLLQFGGEKEKSELSIETATLINILDSYEIVFSVGPYLAGVREAEDRIRATELGLRLYQRLKTVSVEK